MSNNQNGSIWPLIVGVLFVVALFQALFGGGSSSSSSTTPARDNSFERRYVEERFKQEGYSSSESAQAADAILKFQRAQEARKRQ